MVRYQRQPHPSQTFSCTRNSMTLSPKAQQLPALFFELFFAPVCRETGKSVQASVVLMEDFPPNSQIYGHAVIAQIRKSRAACRRRLCRAPLRSGKDRGVERN